MDLCFIDVETTGRFADKHDIVQLACIPVVNGKRQQPFNEFCQPKNWDTIEEEAIRVHGISRQRMKTFQTQEQMLDNFIKYLKQFNVKFVIAGFNVNFDKQFLSKLFNSQGKATDFFTFFDISIHDTLARARSLKGKIKTENNKLETLAKYWGIEIQAHDAISDISATIEVDNQIGKLLGETFVEAEERQKVHVPEFKEMAHLHLHSMYDMVESVPYPKDWLKWAESVNAYGYGIVDHGSAISMSVVNDLNKDSATRGVPGVGLILQIEEYKVDINVWAINNEGYFNAMHLSSIGYDGANEINGVKRSVVTLEALKDHSDGLVFGIGDAANYLGQILIEKGKSEVLRIIKLVNDSLDNVHLEFCPVDVRYTYSNKLGFQPITISKDIVNGNLSKSINLVLAEASDKFGMKCLGVSKANFIPKSDKLLQDIIAKNSYADGKCYQESYHALTTTEIYEGLKYHLGDWLTEDKFKQWIQNSIDIVDSSKDLHVSFDYHLPKVDVPEHIVSKTDDYNKQTYYLLVEKCRQHGRWNNDPVYVERFKKEIDVIMMNKELNFIPYFLFYEDISSYARSKGILQNIGRGSAGGCLISYYLKIIHIDPVATNLPFERFLSHARINGGSFPDIDSDFGDRTEIIRYIHQKYGDGFAQICTFLKMKTKNAIKDAMWALYGKNRRDPDIEAVCELIPDSPQGVDEEAFLYGFTNKEGEYTPGLIETDERIAAFFKQFTQVEKMVKRLIKLVRGWGRHPSAFVVSTLDLSKSRIPTMKMFDKHLNDFINVTQVDAPMVEAHGLVKADILGVTTIQMVSDCIDLIRERTGKDYLQEDDKGLAEIYRLPEDPSVYKDFYNKKTDSSFQFNTNLIKMYIRQFAPTKKEDLASITALCRPGALDAPFMDTTAAQFYFDVRSGNREIQFVHDDLKPILEETNGVFCVSGDSVVSTQSGNKRIVDVKVGDKVLTHEGRYQNVSAFYDNGLKKVVRVRLSQGEDIVCTPDHKILTQFGWVQASKLTRKHLVKSFWTQKERFEIGNDADWLIGILLADGNLKGSSYDISCSSESDAKKIVEVAKAEFGIEGGTVEYRGTCWYANLRQINGNNGFFNKNYKVNRIKKLCKDLKIHNLGCKQKRLPHSFTLSMLAGFFDGDGCIDNGLIRLANRDLAYDLYKAFDSYRIPVSYFEDGDVFTVCVRDLTRLPLKLKKKTKSTKGVKLPRNYIYDFNGVKRSLGSRLCQHFRKSKKDKPISYNQCYEIIGKALYDGRHLKWSSVLSVKEERDEIRVYDITVDNDHSFVVGGNVVHNCYQEQVMRFLVDIAGYTLEESDQIRSAIAKKKKDKMLAAFDRIREATSKRGWTKEQADTICDQVLAFSRYSFNRSHSRCYGDLGYITMYLKKHHPLEWWTSVLNNTNGKSGDSEDKLRFFMHLIGDTVTPPSLQTPSENFVISGDKIVAPLSVLKKVGSKAVKELVEAGPFVDLEDYVKRVKHNKVNVGVFAAIVRGRAADCFIDSKTDDYSDGRLQLLNDYTVLRKSKPFDETMQKVDALSVFLMERETNKCFNKALLSESLVVSSLIKNNEELELRSSKAVPMMYKGRYPVISNVRVAQLLLKEGHDRKMAMILLYEGSSHKSGISKKSGKPYEMVKVQSTDGCSEMEFVLWSAQKALKWPINSPFIVVGELTEDYRGRVTIKVDELSRLVI